MSRPRIHATLELLKPQRLEHHRRLHPSLADSVDTATAYLIKLGKDYETERDAAMADPTLSEMGKRSKAATVALRLVANLDQFRAQHVGNVRNQIEQIETTTLKRTPLRPPSDPAERLAFEMRAREIRDSLRGCSQIERTVAYLSTSDPVVAYALETAPPAVVRHSDAPGSMATLEPFVDPAKVSDAQFTRAAKANPDVAAQADALREIAEAFESDIASMRNVIRADAPEALADAAITVR
jgi:hypothetical protein